MKSLRTKYSAAEKAKIALEAIKGELSMAEIVAKYVVHATQVKTWKNRVLETLPEVFADKSKQKEADYEAQLAELYEHIGRLKVENAFLKKKCKLF